jgi:hypothetical protein
MADLLTFPSPTGTNEIERRADSGPARAAYLRARGEGTDHPRAMQALSLALARGLLGGGVEPDFPLEEIALEEGWERAYAAQCAASLFSARDLSPEESLRVLISQQRQSRRLLDDSQSVLEGPPPLCSCDECGGQYQASVHGAWPNSAAQGQWKAARRDWVEVSTLTQAAAERAQRVLEEGSRSGYWQQQYDQTLSELLGAYLDGGPQYGVLCRSLASLDTRIRQMERSGRDISTEEYAKLIKLRLDSVNQLQRYTESTKAESTSGVQNAIVTVATALEKEFKVSAPDTWSKIASTIAATVQRHGLGLELPA